MKKTLMMSATIFVTGNICSMDVDQDKKRAIAPAKI